MRWDEIQRMLRDTEDARRAFDSTRHIRETFEHLDPGALRALEEQRKYGVSNMVNEIVRQQLLRGGRDHAITEHFRNHSAVDEMLIRQSRVLENQARIHDLVNSATAGLSTRELLRDFGRTMPDVERALRYHHDLRESYSGALQHWDRLLSRPGLSEFLEQQAALSAATWGTSVNEIVERIVAMDGLSGRPHLAARMLEPAFAYGRFATDTVTLLDRAGSEQETNALSGSLVLADEQLVKITAVQEAVVEAPEEKEEAEGESSTPVLYGHFEVQRQDLLSRRAEVPGEAAYPVLVTLSPSAELFERCHRCFVLIDYCNGAGRDRGVGNIFNPATSWLSISIGLAGRIARDRDGLRNFVLNFYNLLYESVTPRRRLLREGLVTEAEYRVIEALKDFRNKWLVHDATQGEDASVDEDRRIMAGHLEWLGFRRTPLTPDEFERLQWRLLDEVEAFLALLVDRLSPPAVEDED